MVYPRKIGNFIYRMAYSKPKNSNSNYGKSVFKECSVLWRGPYILLGYPHIIGPECKRLREI